MDEVQRALAHVRIAVLDVGDQQDAHVRDLPAQLREHRAQLAHR